MIYNHAVLAAFARNNLLLVADLDEYLVTPQRMTVKEVSSDRRLPAALRAEWPVLNSLPILPHPEPHNSQMITSCASGRAVAALRLWVLHNPLRL